MRGLPALLLLLGCGLGEAELVLPGAPPAPVGPPVTTSPIPTTTTTTTTTLLPPTTPTTTPPGMMPADPPPPQAPPVMVVPFVPPLTGHRLAIANDIAIALDPEGPSEDGVQPQVYLASISQRQLLATLALPAGSNPQAVEVSSSGYAYVLASGLGGVVSIDIAHAKLGTFAHVCDAPMDLATRGPDVLVACRGGELVTLASTGVEQVALPSGLRRIAVDPQNHVFVANLNGEVLELGAAAAVKPADVAIPIDLGLTDPGALAPRVAHANTPHRLLPLPTGGALMLYQQSLSGELTLGAPTTISVGDYGGSGVDCQIPATRPSMTTTDGSTFTPQYWVPGAHIVDAALSPSGKMLAVADATGGAVRFQPMNPDPAAFAGDPFTLADGTSVCAPQEPESPLVTDGINTGTSVPVAQPTGVGFAGTTVVVLNLQPLELQTIPAGTVLNEGDPVPAALHIPLRTRQPSPLIEGQQLFFANPSPAPVVMGEFPGGSKLIPNFRTLACASCHPDGLSNGATTTLSGLTHRVMPLAGRLRSATHFHWVGGAFHDEVAEGTWHHNMGGAELMPSQETSLLAFLRQLQAPAAPAGDAALIDAGREAFHKGLCDSCHVPGTDYTNDDLADIGRGMHKVPSLIGLVYTAPYMSDGCASTLEARFNDPACGGANHGAVQLLTPGEVTSLIAFLKTL